MSGWCQSPSCRHNSPVKMLSSTSSERSEMAIHGISKPYWEMTAMEVASQPRSAVSMHNTLSAEEKRCRSWKWVLLLLVDVANWAGGPRSLPVRLIASSHTLYLTRIIKCCAPCVKGGVSMLPCIPGRYPSCDRAPQIPHPNAKTSPCTVTSHQCMG